MESQLIISWVIGLLISIIFLILGAILLFGKVKKNMIFGYRTPLSMENEDNWKYANKILAIIVFISGLILLVETIALNILKTGMKIFMPVFMGSLLLAVVVMCIVPEIFLRKYINKDK